MNLASFITGIGLAMVIFAIVGIASAIRLSGELSKFEEELKNKGKKNGK